MLILVLIIAFILLLIIVLVTVVRKHDAKSYTDQERDPFHIEMSRLAAAGLLYEQEEKTYGRPRKSYTVTPAGEAALRTWLREPMNDPGILRLYFAGIVGPADVVALARQQRDLHRERLEQYDRVDDLLGERDGWDAARKVARLGRAFEERCADFWSRQSSGPMRGRALKDQRGDDRDSERDDEARRDKREKSASKRSKAHRRDQPSKNEGDRDAD